jgi:hypothetical protein
MIKKTLIFFGVFMAVYAVCAAFIHWPSKSLTQWEDNERLVGSFLFSGQCGKVNTVIVGSSMAFRMTIGHNPHCDTVYNLSLGGQGIFEGLDILKRSGRLPRYLLIESNVIYRQPRNNYASSFFMPGVYHLKKQFEGFRHEYRPITFAQYLYFGIGGYVKRFFDASPAAPGEEPLTGSAVVTAVGNDGDESSNLKQKHLEKLLAGYDKTLRSTEWQSVTDMLYDYVDYFERQGVTVVFFEMPSEQVLIHSGLNKKVRDIIETSFPGRRFVKSIEQPTTDGVHLSPEVAGRYLDTVLVKVGE